VRLIKSFFVLSFQKYPEDRILLAKKAKKAAKEIAEKQNENKDSKEDECSDVIFKQNTNVRLGSAAKEALSNRREAEIVKQKRRQLIMRRRTQMVRVEVEPTLRSE